MDVLIVAYYTALRNLKDIRMLAILVACPIVMVIILGSVLGGYFSDTVIAKTNVAYLNDDSGEFGSSLDSYLFTEGVQDYVALTPVLSFELGQKALADGTVEAFVYVPHYSLAKTTTVDDPRIHVLTHLQSPVILSILTNYVDVINSIQISKGNVPIHQNFVNESGVSTSGKTPRAIDYYAVQVLLQVMLMGGWYGITAIHDDKEKNTALRFSIAPISTNAELIGKIIASVSLLSIQAIAVMLFTKFVYGANWGGNALAITVTLLLFSVLSVALGLFMGCALRDSSKAFGVLFVAMVFFSTISGAFTPITPGSTLARIAWLSPNNYAKTALFATIYGRKNADIVSSLGVLLSLTLLLLASAVFMQRRKTA